MSQNFNKVKTKGYKKNPVKKSVKKISKETPLILTPEEEEVNRRADWEHNNELIYSNYIAIAMEKRRTPKLKEVADQTGLSIVTVWKHTQAPDFDTIKKKYSVFADAALFQLAAKAAEGKSREWSELFFKVMFGVGDKKQLDVTSGGKAITSTDLSKLSVEELVALKAMKQKINGE